MPVRELMVLASVRERTNAVSPGSLAVTSAHAATTAAVASLERRVMGALTAMSLLLASLGVYGLTADSARQREREVAVRLVLGATPGTIIRLFLTQAQRVGIGGVALGLALALAVARTLRGHVFAVHVFDPIVFVGAAGILLGVVTMAAFLPARRASHTDPAVILRQS